MLDTNSGLAYEPCFSSIRDVLYKISIALILTDYSMAINSFESTTYRTCILSHCNNKNTSNYDESKIDLILNTSKFEDGALQ